MTTDYDNEKWVWLYRSALLELEDSLMAGRIMDARVAIMARVEQLKNIPGIHAAEKLAIEDALGALRMLEREEIRHEAERQRTLVQEALEKLQAIEPKINQLKHSSEN
jgi:4-aminobutyrate aminotransferase-like enzyme